MIFLTVGSSLPFDRLVAAVDELIAPAKLDEVFAQIGDTLYRPQKMRWVQTLSKNDFDRVLADARFVISHAGVGTIASALSLGKPLIVMPRQRAFGEAVNDHQVSTAERFGAAGHILVAHDAQQLATCLAQVVSFTPKPRSAQPRAVSQRVAAFLNTLVDP
ncbi:MAG: glycosyltransferase [Planctomycetota bacterium]|nr:glycosyltransferase [Planctomycetota bacterium]